MPKNFKKLSKVSIATTIALGAFALVGNQYATASWMVPSLLAVIISILVGNLTLLWEYREDLPDIATIQDASVTALEGRLKPLVESVGRLTPQLEQVESAINASKQETRSLELEIREGMKVGRDLVRILSHDAQGITRTRLSLSERGTAVHRMGSRTLNDVLGLFDVTRRGYIVHGEQLSLLAYVQFWREMLHTQHEINKVSTDPDATRLIARATHSNEIELWIPEHNQAAQELLSLQKQFLEAGGRIVRLLLSHTQTPTELSERVRAKMETYGIEARHLYYPHPFEYDFIWVSTLEADIVLTWYSGANGKGLSRCEVVDGVEPPIERMWERVGTASEDADGPFRTVPPGRHRVNR